jgi:hypothetical protein
MISGYGLGILLVSNDEKPETTSSTAIKLLKSRKKSTVFNAFVLNVAGPIPSLVARGVKTYHIFTSEIEGKEKLKLENSFYINSLAVEKGDEVAVNFYDLNPIQHERHSITIVDPYKIDIDIAFAENDKITITANNQLTDQYYSKKLHPLLDGRVLALPQ